MSNIGANDLIYYSDNEGKIYSGGFSVNSIMIKEGFSPIMTLNNISVPNSDSYGENVSDLFADLVIPSWSMYNPKNDNYFIQKYVKNNEEDNSDSDGYISDDLYEKLLGLVSVSEKELRGGNKKTRKMAISINKNKNKNENEKIRKKFTKKRK